MSIFCFLIKELKIMGYATCRKCNGSGRYHDKKSGKTFDCSACGGSGSNKSLWTTKCDRCRKEIVYKANTSSPRFCRDCRNIELTKTCAQYGCDNTIKYKIGWTDVSDYCGSCRNKRQKGFSSSICPGVNAFGCGKVVWSPPGKRYTHCRECSERKRVAAAEKWKTKSCNGCGGEIRYNVDWSKVPEYCKECNKWQYKVCASPNCNNQIKFKKYWSHPPKFCDMCKSKPGIAVTHRGSGNKPDHTTYSLKSGLRRSFDHNEGRNVHNDHFSEGSKGTSIDRDD
jgi:hypothetical protein